MLLSHLPATSAYAARMADDDDLAKYLAEQPARDSAPAGPRLTDWTPEVDMLARLVDRVGEFIHVVIATSGGKPGRLTPLPRPHTAVDRARRQQRMNKHHALLAELEQARIAQQT